VWILYTGGYCILFRYDQLGIAVHCVSKVDAKLDDAMHCVSMDDAILN